MALLLGGITPLCQGQWTAVPLHPPGSYYSGIGGVSATRQYGIWKATSIGSPSKPVIWSGSSASLLSLAPGASDWGALQGGNDQVQYGDFRGRAAIWFGTVSSRVDLDADGPLGSTVTGAFGGQQVGVRNQPNGTGHAVIWYGTPQSMIDLHPSWARTTWVYGTDGTRQAGFYTTEFGGARAALWYGTAASMVDLNPPGAGTSTIYGVTHGQQVGYATFGTGGDRAAVWSGTPESFVDLTPPGSYALLHATCGTAQVGILNGFDAAIWFGTAQSVVNLHDLLPTGYYASTAYSVFEQDGIFYVGGWAERSGPTLREAFLWYGPGPCYANCDHSTAAPVLNVSDFSCFLQRYAAADAWANCDKSTAPPILNVQDFSCFLTRFAQGCAN